MNKGQDLILVTGATGTQGGAVSRQLLAKGHKVRVMTRKPESEKAQQLAKLGAEVIQGDLNTPSSLEKALEGGWGVFAVQNTWEAGVQLEEEQGKRFAELAKKAGVQHYVYTSVSSADRKTGIPHFDNKWRIEETVRKTGFPSYAILRPVGFMENYVNPEFNPGLQHGKLPIALNPETKSQVIAAEDIGRFAVLLFEEHEKMNGAALDIAGDEKTMPETAEILGNALGRKIEFVQVPIEEIRKMSNDFAIMFEWVDRVGYSVDISSLVDRTGIKPLTLTQWAAKLKRLATTGS